ncbi:MAG: glycosyltransferase [Nitrososphaerales archaeon]
MKPLEKFTNLTRRLNLETIILDKVTSVELFYNAVDVLVSPFRKPYLPTDPPVTIVEALSSGTPLITTPVGAIKGVVNEDRGLLVKPGNVNMLKDALEYLLSDEKVRKKLGSNARDYTVKNLSLEVIGQKIKKIFQEISSQD